MLRALRQPRWIVAALVVGLLAALFIRLGLWQLDRRDERRLENAVATERLDSEPVDLGVLLSDAGSNLESIEFRRASLTGEFDASAEVLIRSQVELGQAGFHVITPFVTRSGVTILLNRGWVPLTMDEVPVSGAPPPEDGHTLVAWVMTTETRPSLGPEDPPGDLTVFNRVDVERIGGQLSRPIAPVYGVLVGERGSSLPIPVRLPDFTDEGPHLAYAIQWFGFALVGLVGFVFLIRRKGQSRNSSSV